ncbi:MAG: ABC transporter permease [Acidobacteria bacterium]|nr:ABC transporter permease [Acidobacteriota bacterium]
MSFRRTRAMARKEVLHIWRDPRSLAMALAVPVLLLFLFGTALSLDVDRIPTLIYDADGGSGARELIHRFQGSRFFQIRGMASGPAEIERRIDRNEIFLGVSIPHNYSRQIAAGREAPVQILIDGSDSNTASIAMGYVEALIRAYAFELRKGAQNRKGGGQALVIPAEARLRVWYNSQLQSKNYIVPGLIAVILMIIASLLTSLTVAREWEMGTMEQLLSTPVRPAEMVLGKMLAFFGVGVIDTAIAIAVGILFFDVPMRGNGLFLVASSCIFLFGALFWGIFLSAAARSQLLAFQIGMITSFLPSFLLSGFVYAVESMPPVIRTITHLVPARHFITVLKGIFLKGVGLEVLWVETLFLAVFAALVFVLATRKMKQKVA